jgi:8-amino-7-oxononanoate synthase
MSRCPAVSSESLLSPVVSPIPVSDRFDLAVELSERKARGLYRVRDVLEDPQGPQVEVGGRRYVSFCSNDYLGLSGHPEVKEALKRGVDRYGVGSGGSHLIVGHTRAHHALEEELAEFTGRTRALVFSTGYMANLGILAALLGRNDMVAEDRLNHASLIDAARLSGATLRRYAHCDPYALDRFLGSCRAGRKLVASDGVFSMDGDTAPLPALADVALRRQAWLMVDDAHGFGVLGATGAGTLEQFGLSQDQVPILMGTFGKALGTFGAFVAGGEALIETLIQRARTYIYTTAPPAALAEATRVSLRIARQEGWRRDRVQALAERFARGAASFGLPIAAGAGHIQPVEAGDVAVAMRWQEGLRRRGFLVQAMRPPTVPRGARLRITFSAAHSDVQVDGLLEALAAVIR